MIYYNEIDKNCIAWLKQLIVEGHLPHGDVDDRDIRDIKPRELAPYTQCHFFAGIGGWPLALQLAGIPTDIPLWTGSCPCQPFSAAGRRGGFADERHLWPSWHHLISVRKPAVVLGEQVGSATDWLRLVRGDLEALEYAVGAMPVEAASAGADHLRDRFWFVGDRPSEQVGSAGQPRQRRDVVDADEPGSQGPRVLPERADQCAAGSAGVADAPRDGQRRARESIESGEPQESTGGLRAVGSDVEWVLGADGKARRVKSGVRLLAHGVPNRVGLLRGFGNAIDPRPAAAFIEASFLAIADARRRLEPQTFGSVTPNSQTQEIRS